MKQVSIYVPLYVTLEWYNVSIRLSYLCSRVPYALFGYWLARQKIPIVQFAHESTTNFTVRQRSINIDTVERSQQNRLYMPMYSLLRRLSSQPCHSQKIFY